MATEAQATQENRQLCIGINQIAAELKPIEEILGLSEVGNLVQKENPESIDLPHRLEGYIIQVWDLGQRLAVVQKAFHALNDTVG